MKLHYTGKLERLEPGLEKKLDARFAKLGKLLDRGSEKEAHIILTSERHLRRAEITINWYDHALVGVERAKDSLGDDVAGYRREFLALAGTAAQLSGPQLTSR